MDKSIYLKIKVKSLTAEARIIRKEERKLKWWYKKSVQLELSEQQLAETQGLRIGLQMHRRIQLRQEARSTHIAYAFIRGKSYFKTEIAHKPVNWDSVRVMVKKYGSLEGFDEWLKTAESLIVVKKG